MSNVLLVVKDETLGAQVAERLESRGNCVTWCRGPGRPDFVCIGGRGERCPLAAEADIVVLDGWLASDQVRRGTPSWHLFLYYLSFGVPVVVLVGPDGLPGPLPMGDIVAMRREAGASAIAASVDTLLDETPARMSLSYAGCTEVD